MAVEMTGEDLHAIRNGLASAHLSLALAQDDAFSTEEHDLLVQKAFEAVAETIDRLEAMQRVMNATKKENGK